MRRVARSDPSALIVDCLDADGRPGELPALAIDCAERTVSAFGTVLGGQSLLPAPHGEIAFSAAGEPAIGFFGRPPVAQQQLPAVRFAGDGQASPTLAAAGGAYDPANENDFRASVAQAFAALHEALRAYGLVAQ